MAHYIYCGKEDGEETIKVDFLWGKYKCLSIELYAFLN